MKARPKSIAFICWFLILTPLLSIITTASTYNHDLVVEIMESNPLAVSLQYALMAISIVLIILSGVLMLKGKNIGRLIYIGWAIVILVIGLFTSPSITMLLPNFIMFALFAFFLFRPKANVYFSEN